MYICFVSGCAPFGPGVQTGRGSPLAPTHALELLLDVCPCSAAGSGPALCDLKLQAGERRVPFGAQMWAPYAQGRKRKQLHPSLPVWV